MDTRNFQVPSYTLSSMKHIMRHQVGIDKYARFKWRGVDSYETDLNNGSWEGFGCFIINNKDLKWTNYAQFTDEYTKPLFSSSEYLGTTFNQKELTLKIGAYYITAADYRALINWLSPEVKGEFEYGYNTGWVYKVKISSFSVSTYYVIDFSDGEDIYYAEFDIKLKTTEDNLVSEKQPWDYTALQKDSAVLPQNTTNNYILFHYHPSELSTVLQYIHNWKLKDDYGAATYKVELCQIADDIPNIDLVNGLEGYISNRWTLFTCQFTDITDTAEELNIGLEYNSQTGVLYLNGYIASECLTSYNGVNILTSFQSNKNLLPGSLNNPTLNRKIQVYNNTEIYSTCPEINPLFISIQLIDKNGNFLPLAGIGEELNIDCVVHSKRQV